MPERPSQVGPDDHRSLFAAERDELAAEERREQRAVQPTDEAHEDRRQESGDPGTRPSE